MPRIRWPRRGSMQYWPRKRAKRQQARIRSWAVVKELKPIGFAGYKIGMAQVIYTDAGKNSVTKGEEIACPVTLIECPPLKIIGFQAYENDAYGKKKKCGAAISATKQAARRLKVKKKDASQKIADAEKNIADRKSTR